MDQNPNRYTITAALPYTNGPVHIGHLAGVYVPADIYARYQRLQNKDVVFICGSDEHGVPITIKAKKEGITPQEGWKLDFYKDVHDAYEKHRAEAENDNRFPILPERFVRDIRKVMPDDGIVTLDNGVYKIWFARNYPAYHPNTLLLDNALASMGAGLPSAIAAKLVKPDVPVMSVCGDGGFMMNSQEIETAVRLKLDLIVIILRDDAYGMITVSYTHLTLPTICSV